MGKDRQKRMTWIVIGFALNIPAVGVCWAFGVSYSWAVIPSAISLILSISDSQAKK